MTPRQRIPAGRRRARATGLDEARHRAVGDRLRAIRHELLRLTASIAAAYPRTAKVHRLARSIVAPIDELRRELLDRYAAEHPDTPAATIDRAYFDRPTSAGAVVQ